MVKIVRHLVQTTGHLVLDMNLRVERVPSVVNHVVHIAVWAVEASHIIVRLVQYNHPLVLLVRRLLLRVSVTQGTQAQTADRALLAPPEPTKSRQAQPCAPLVESTRTPLQSLRRLRRRVSRALSIPIRRLPAQYLLRVLATQASPAPTAARARHALLEPTKTRRVVSCAPHALRIPNRLLRAWPSQLALAVPATPDQPADRARHALPENTKPPPARWRAPVVPLVSIPL